MGDYAREVTKELKNETSTLHKQVVKGGQYWIHPPCPEGEDPADPSGFYLVKLFFWDPARTPKYKARLQNGCMPCPRCKQWNSTKKGGIRKDHPYRRVITKTGYYGLMGMFKLCLIYCRCVSRKYVMAHWEVFFSCR
jgi:hypothetical protein